MKKLLFLFLLFLSTSLLSQKTVFLDRSFHKRTSEKYSDNKREYFVKDSVIEINDYNKNGLFRTGVFYGFSELKNLDEFIWYNSNRQYDRSPELVLKNRSGVIKYYNKNGEPTAQQQYIEDKVKHIQIWNNSKSYLVNGSGKYECDSDKVNEKLVRIFKDSIETSSYVVRELKKDTIYYKTDKQAYPKNGLKAFYKDIAKKVQYPGFANLMGINKKITVEFVVDKDGKLTDFVALNNKSLNFEKKAIKKLEKMPSWIPAFLNGKNVKTRFRIPLTFRH